MQRSERRNTTLVQPSSADNLHTQNETTQEELYRISKEGRREKVVGLKHGRQVNGDMGGNGPPQV